MKATEQYFPVVLFINLYEMILTFESVDEILKCVLFRLKVVLLRYGVYYAVQFRSIFQTVD